MGYKKKYLDLKDKFDKYKKESIDLSQFSKFMLSEEPILFLKEKWDVDTKSDKWILIQRKIENKG